MSDAMKNHLEDEAGASAETAAEAEDVPTSDEATSNEDVSTDAVQVKVPVHAQHAKQKPKTAKRALIALGVVVGIIVVAVCAMAIYFNMMIDQGRSQFAQTEWPEDIRTVEYNGQTYEYNPDIITVCIIGNDKYRHNSGLYFNGQADAVDVIAIDSQTGKTTCITIPRDTMVEQWETDLGTEDIIGTVVQQLCLAYSHGHNNEFSSENVCNSVSIILDGVPIDYYFTIEETAIRTLTDAIGGVTLVPMDTIPVNDVVEGPTGGEIFEGQEITLNGNQAMQYVLWRDTNVSESADRRHMRQQQFIKELASQTIQAVKSNPAFLMELYNVASAEATTNLDASQFSYLASIILDHGITQFDTVALQGEVVQSQVTGWEELTLDEESTRQAVLDIFYKPAE